MLYMKNKRTNGKAPWSNLLLRLLPIVVLILVGQNAWAQSRQVTGIVKDITGETVIGASVVEKGTTNGTITDDDGGFRLTVSNDNAILVFSFIGFQPQEISVKGKTIINVTMREEIGRAHV